MPNQQLSLAQPNEGLSAARKVMDDAVAFYLAHGGPAVARDHLERLANDLKFYHGSDEVYQAALDQILQAEKAEEQAEQQRQQQHDKELILAIIGTVKPNNTQNVPAASCEYGVLPPKLSTAKAMLLWCRLQQAGIIDEHYQPVNLSRTQSAVLADEMLALLSSENELLLGIDDKWTPFETLWHRKNMRSDHYRSTTQKKASDFRSDIHKLLTDTT